MSKGLKRICMNCGMRFYDLDKTPIICPSCETEFTGEEKVKVRRGRVAAVAEAPVKKDPVAVVEDEDDLDDIDPDDDIVSLDDVDEDDLDDDDEEETFTIDSDPDDLDDVDDIEDDLDDEDEDEDEDDNKN